MEGPQETLALVPTSLAVANVLDDMLLDVLA